jgi:pimeloyl-ACP methyl ester carboxylesterase
MTIQDDITTATTGFVDVGGAELWYEQRGEGPDVVLIAGLSDPVEAWELQLAGLSDRYRVTAFDNRGAGRSPMVPDGFTVADMADDVAGLMRSLGIERAHVAGFSGGSMTAQELAIRHPGLVRSLVLQSTCARWGAYERAGLRSWRWLVEAAPGEREALEAFFLWIYTPRAHDEGMVDAIIDDALAFPHAQSPEGFRRQLAVWEAHDTHDRLHAIAVPTLVLAGELDMITRPHLGAAVADLIPGAEYRIQPGEAHQPFQERPEEWNRTVQEFWSGIVGS